MLYQSVSNPFEKSVFRRTLTLQKRKELYTSMIKRKKQDHFCCLVVEYAPLIKSYRDYELMCVNGRLSLKMLQEYIMVKLNKEAVRSGLLFEVKGKIKHLGDSIGQLSAKCSEQDGFLYIFVRSQNTF